MIFEKVQTLQSQNLLLWEPSIVEGKTPWEVFLFHLNSHQGIELHSNRHVPILVVLIRIKIIPSERCVVKLKPHFVKGVQFVAWSV